MQAFEIESLTGGFSCFVITIEDLRGDGDHWLVRRVLGSRRQGNTGPAAPDGSSHLEGEW